MLMQYHKTNDNVPEKSCWWNDTVDWFFDQQGEPGDRINIDQIIE